MDVSEPLIEHKSASASAPRAVIWLEPALREASLDSLLPCSAAQIALMPSSLMKLKYRLRDVSEELRPHNEAIVGALPESKFARSNTNRRTLPLSPSKSAAM